jgi:serine-type D-Ala-D-Ala carboxypeptidase/endopeptidase
MIFASLDVTNSEASMSGHSIARVVLPVLFASCLGACALEPKSKRIDTAKVDELGALFVSEAPVRALSLGIIKDGVTYAFNYGEYDRARHRRPDAETRYAIGSLTKTFAATLLAQAVLEGRVSLGDDVRRYLDGPYPNLEFNGEPIRLVHLLNHNSGLPGMFPQSLQGNPSADPRVERERIAAERPVLERYTDADFLSELRTLQLEATPGTRFRYSNAAAELLRRILEKVYGKPFAALVSEKITRPLGMRDTTITLTPHDAERFVGYDAEGVSVGNNADFAPAAGGIKSTVLDMLKYTRWHLAERDAAVRLTHQSQWRIDGNYSLGINWQMISMPNYRVIWQEGGVPGFASYCVLYPELDLGIVAFTNALDPQTAGRLSTLIKQLTRQIDARAVDLP